MEIYGRNPAIKYILEKSKKIWHKGHPLLSSIATTATVVLKMINP